MQSFLDFLTEHAYYLFEGPPAPGNQLFHKDLGIPTTVSGPPVGMRLYYGYHSAQERAPEKGIAVLPDFVPPNYTLVEVETNRGAPVKWVIRVPYNAQDDLVLVVLPTGKVKTVWKNHRQDTHRTLNRSIYTLPGQLQRR